MLALEPGHNLSKELLAERLWEGRPPACYIGTLESYVCVVRRQLRRVSSRQMPLVTSNGGYVLDPQHVEVDVTEVRRLLRGDEDQVCRALDLTTGVLFADEPYAAWAGDAREAFDQVVGEACLRSARDANLRGDHVAAVRLAREASARAPFSEVALQELMTALVETGARTEAIGVYTQMRERLARELGLGLSPQTNALFLSILRRHEKQAHRIDRAALATMVQLIHHALAGDPTALAGVPLSQELGHLLRP